MVLYMLFEVLHKDQSQKKKIMRLLNIPQRIDIQHLSFR